jgi:hypothetical protein
MKLTTHFCQISRSLPHTFEWRGAQLIKHIDNFILYLYVFRRKKQNKELFYMKETKEMKYIAVVARTFHFEGNASLKELNGAPIVNVCFMQLKIHSRNTERETDRMRAALAKQHPERNRFQVADGIV